VIPEDLVYFRVSPRIWYEDGWSDDAKLLALYLLTNEHRIAEGLYRLPKDYILGDLKWSAERLAEPFAQLSRDGFMKYDETARVVFVVNALKYQAPANDNCRKSAAKKLRELPETPLFGDLLASARLYCEPFAKRLPELLPERFGEPIPEPPALAPALNSNSKEHSRPRVAVDEAPPVDNSADQERGESIDQDQAADAPASDAAPACTSERPEVPDAILAIVAEITGVEADTADAELTAAAAGLLARIDELVAAQGPMLEGRRDDCRRSAFERIRVRSAEKRIGNLPAYLRVATKRAGHLGDLVGDDLVKELRTARRPKRKSEPRPIAEALPPGFAQSRGAANGFEPTESGAA
jgi:hypothetical protein